MITSKITDFVETAFSIYTISTPIVTLIIKKCQSVIVYIDI